MIYIIQGQEPCFIRDKINEITSKNEGEVSYFDGLDKNLSVSSIVEACDGNSLFSQGSIVLVEQPFFLIRKCDEKDIKPLLDYVDRPLYDTQLIFYTYQNNFNSKLRYFKQICANAQLITLNSLDQKNFSNYVRSRISEEKIDISSDALYYLIDISRRNATLMNQNLDILKLYPGKIDAKAVGKLCTASDENDGFELINAMTARDVSKAVAVERRLLKENDSILSVIGLLANQLRFLYLISYLNSSGKSSREIQEISGASEYRISKANETLRQLKGEQILELLHKLSELDISCKSDYSIPDPMKFEIFILEFLKRNSYAGN